VSFDPVSFALGAASAKGGPGGASTLSGLTDVDISNPSDGQTLVYNASSGKWENGASGGVLFVHFEYDEQLDMEVCDTTWQTIYDAMASGTVVLVSMSITEGGLAGARYDWVATAVTPGLDNNYPENYVILVFGPSESNTIVGNYYICSSATDYPHTV
jgi:hypothetical protein